jgi:hypothetical protein
VRRDFTRKSSGAAGIRIAEAAALIVSFLRDVRLAARSFLRTPIWFAGLILTIGLGIGSTAAVDGFARGLGSADGMASIAGLLRTAAIAVLVIACANVASFLLARATARARETAVRVAVGAGRTQLIRQALADSFLIAITGAAFAALFAWWCGRALPATLFDQDADKMVFAADPMGLAVIIILCTIVTIVCGLLPLIETRHDDPGAIMQRENSGPSRLAMRVGTGLVLVQMTGCTVLVISAGLLLAGFRSSLQTTAGLRLSSPAVVSMEVLQTSSKSVEMSNGLNYFAAAAQAARDVAGATSIAWAANVPGNRPAWRSYEFESANIPRRAVELSSIRFSGRTLEQIVTPPAAGRLFGTIDNGPCSGVVLSVEAARQLGGDPVVGRSIELPSGDWADVIGVVRPLDQPMAARAYHYTDIGEGAATYRVPQLGQSQQIDLDTNIVTANYFDFMGLRVVAGRAFDATRDACRVAMVNEEAALLLGGDVVNSAVIDRLGRRATIVGIVTSTRLRVQQRAVAPTVYFPYAQDFIPRMTMLMETNGVDAAKLSRLHLRLADIPGGREDRIIVATLFDHMSRTAFAPERIATVLVTTLAGVALALGGLALYGVMHDAARRRHREFALRIALGAQGGHVFTQVLQEGARLVAAGSVAGIAGAMLVARWIGTITPPGDGVSVFTWLLAPVSLTVAVLIASVLPARKALASDPLTIMRAG